MGNRQMRRAKAAQPGWYVLLALCLFLAACQTHPGTATPTPPRRATPPENETLYAAPESGQILVQDGALRIGVGNLAWETYRDEQGHTVEGARVDLWFFFKDHPEHEVQVRAHEGQVLTIQGYTIRVVEINLTDRMVVLGVKLPP